MLHGWPGRMTDSQVITRREKELLSQPVGFFGKTVGGNSDGRVVSLPVIQSGVEEFRVHSTARVEGALALHANAHTREALITGDRSLRPRKGMASFRGRAAPCAETWRPNLGRYDPNVTGSVSSAEPKAIETAGIGAGVLNVPVEVVEGLHEHERENVGFLEKARFEQSIRRFFEQPAELDFWR